jgi:hypothetical protein
MVTRRARRAWTGKVEGETKLVLRVSKSHKLGAVDYTINNLIILDSITIIDIIYTLPR